MANIPDNVIVDDCDRDFLEAMGKWYIDGNGYCVRKPYDPATKKTGKAIYMHRVILKRKLGRPIIPGMFCDHASGLRTDCSRANLREVTHQQNNMNRRAKGYFWNERRRKWQAEIQVNGKKKFLGYHDIESEAAAAYARAKAIYHVIP